MDPQNNIAVLRAGQTPATESNYACGTSEDSGVIVATGLRRSQYKPSPLASSIAFALSAFVASPVIAQDTRDAQSDIAQDADPETEQLLEEVMVTGVRSSLLQASDVKRNSEGVVDAIVAEDMGKFPDTNLAESLQRITGVSIDRTGQLGAEGAVSVLTSTWCC